MAVNKLIKLRRAKKRHCAGSITKAELNKVGAEYEKSSANPRAKSIAKTIIDGGCTLAGAKRKRKTTATAKKKTTTTRKKK